MKIHTPKPFTFEGGERAVLLLHGFTGNSADVRMIGRFLEKNGYTCHAPIYRGHGGAAEDLLNYTPEDWWQDVLAAYETVKNMGHEEIAVCGLSLGGVFSLKLAYSKPVKGIIPMCAPMYLRSEVHLYQGVLEYARGYKQLERKSEEQIEAELSELDGERLRNLISKNNALLKEVRENIDLIYAPTFVVQARNDEMINPESANIIFNGIESVQKQIKWYEESGHAITFGKERDLLNEDILEFLNSLDWKQ